MDTLKDKQNLDALAEAGHPPWQVWDTEVARPSCELATEG